MAENPVPRGAQEGAQYPLPPQLWETPRSTKGGREREDTHLPSFICMWSPLSRLTIMISVKSTPTAELNVILRTL